MPRRRILLSCGALAVSIALVAPAAAQNNDVQVAPDSPAGTEYQLPVDRARERAGGGGSGASSGKSGEAPLFGAGVEAPAPGATIKNPRAGKRAGGPRATPTPTPTPTTTAPGERTDLGRSTPETVRGQVSTPDGGGGGLVAIGAGAAGVLLIGGLAGLAWRRRAGTS